MHFDRYPRIPRRREHVAGIITRWVICLAACVLIGWLAAQGF